MRKTPFVNMAVTPEARARINAACLKAGGAVGFRVPQYDLITAALAVAEAHPEEHLANLRALRTEAEAAEAS